MSVMQQEGRRRHADASSRLRQRAAQLLSTYRREYPDADIPAVVMSGDDTGAPGAPRCPICQQSYEFGDELANISCNHTYHEECLNAWCAACHEQGNEPRCPICRSLVVMVGTVMYDPGEEDADSAVTAVAASQYEIGTPPLPPEAPPGTPPASPGTPFGTPASATLPWWPTGGAETTSIAHHASTQLPNGRLSFIVDPGAWTNLMGANLARRLTKTAMRNGIKPRQAEMAEPMTIQGVGNGTQGCKYKIEVPIAVPHSDGTTQHHLLTSPIVEGTGGRAAWPSRFAVAGGHPGNFRHRRPAPCFSWPGPVRHPAPAG